MANIEKTIMYSMLDANIKDPFARINERKLNDILDSLPIDKVQNLIRRKLPNTDNKRKIVQIKQSTYTPKLKNIIKSIGLLDEHDHDRRVHLFVGYCKFHDYSLNTTMKYFNLLRKTNVFGESELRPDKISFAHTGKNHVRIISINNFEIFANYLHQNFSEYTAPILIAYYTALRTIEILQFTAYTLYQLKEKHEIVNIKRKQTVIKPNEYIQPIYWKPIYNTHLNLFIEHLIELYQETYDVCVESSIDTRLFNVTPKTLNNRLKQLYFKATNSLPPNGFGIHSFRNMLAMIMSRNSQNIIPIQLFLQHKNPKVTRKYINADFTHTTNEFNRLTNYKFAHIRKNLEGDNKL